MLPCHRLWIRDKALFYADLLKLMQNYAIENNMHLEISKPDSAIKKSAFVTVVAIIFMLLSSGSIVLSIWQCIESSESFLNAFKQPQNDLFLTFSVFMMLLNFALSIFTLASSMGLLIRKPWSRIAFVISMSVNVLLKIILLITATNSFYFTTKASLALELRKYPIIELFLNLMDAFVLIVYIGIAAYSIISIGVSAWLIKCFLSEKIKHAFHAPSRA
jgi:hypothetical protein